MINAPQTLKESQLTPFKLERYFAKYEFSTKYLLSSSDCESVPLGTLLDFEPNTRAEFENLWLGYIDSQGSQKLRIEISNLYESIQPTHVLVHSGAQEAIYSFFQSFFHTTDHVIVLNPCYQSLYSVAQAKGVDVSLWNLVERNSSWEIDLATLKQKIKPNTKAVIINFPHNPTGFMPTLRELHSIIDLCREKNIYLFSDEVYRGLELPPTNKLPAVCDLYEKGISLGVLSKTYGLPGLRIGWVATKSMEVLTSMASYKDYLTICNSAPSEFLATLALRHAKSLEEKNKNIILENLALLKKFFLEFSDIFEPNIPSAGPITFVKLKKLSAEALCDGARVQAKVLLLPSIVYDYGDAHIRIGLGRKNFPEALDAFSHFLKKL